MTSCLRHTSDSRINRPQLQNGIMHVIRWANVRLAERQAESARVVSQHANPAQLIAKAC